MTTRGGHAHVIASLHTRAMRSARQSSIAAAVMLAATLPAHAAGGHFDVDDASALDPGRCQVELWALRAPAPGATLIHAGPACRIGPVELGLNVDRLSTAAGARNSVGPNLKWVMDPLAGRLSAGIVWSAAVDPAHGGRPAQALYVPLTWSLAESLQVHANIGLDRESNGGRSRRQGLAGEWAASDRISVIAERARIVGEWGSRVGGRVALGPSLSLDLSVARVGARGDRVYALGLNHDFTR